MLSFRLGQQHEASDLPVRYGNVIVASLEICSIAEGVQLRLKEANLILVAAAAEIYDLDHHRGSTVIHLKSVQLCCMPEN